MWLQPNTSWYCRHENDKEKEAEKDLKERELKDLKERELKDKDDGSNETDSSDEDDATGEWSFKWSVDVKLTATT